MLTRNIMDFTDHVQEPLIICVATARKQQEVKYGEPDLKHSPSDMNFLTHEVYLIYETENYLLILEHLHQSQKK